MSVELAGVTISIAVASLMIVYIAKELKRIRMLKKEKETH